MATSWWRLRSLTNIFLEFENDERFVYFPSLKTCSPASEKSTVYWHANIRLIMMEKNLNCVSNSLLEGHKEQWENLKWIVNKWISQYIRVKKWRVSIYS